MASKLEIGRHVPVKILPSMTPDGFHTCTPSSQPAYVAGGIAVNSWKTQGVSEKVRHKEAKWRDDMVSLRRTVWYTCRDVGKNLAVVECPVCPNIETISCTCISKITQSFTSSVHVHCSRPILSIIPVKRLVCPRICDVGKLAI